MSGSPSRRARSGGWHLAWAIGALLLGLLAMPARSDDDTAPVGK